MSGRIRRIPGHHHRTELRSGWELASTPAGLVESPLDPRLASLSWLATGSLGPVAAILRALGNWTLDGPETRFDAQEWWYRLRFPRPSRPPAQAATILGFDGLATVAQAWLNGSPLLASDNMFISHEVAVDDLLAQDNELLLRFRSLDALLEARRPRPRWRTPMVAHQRLNWFRTTLLGRTPGWSPPVAAVGPWRPIWLETRERLQVGTPRILTRVNDRNATVDVECEVCGLGEFTIAAVVLVVSRAGKEHSVPLTRAAAGDVFSGRLVVDAVSLWWPHTHGEPALYDARLDARLSSPSNIGAGLQADPRPVEIPLGRIGFRTLEVNTRDGDFAIRVNGQAVFCRGACWTPLDCVTLHSSDAAVEAAVAQMAAAGLNMVRVGGTMVYETDAFLDACDTNGVLLWQDFMFANMDYPEGDAAFDRSVTTEATQMLPRLAGRPCVAVLCGNSEGEQQAAMWGAPRDRWTHGLFHKLLPELCAALAADIPYWPSSAHGGDFPHQTNSGTVSYYGVGAYLRPLTDARRAEVRFATECLAFANVAEESSHTDPRMDARAHSKVHSPLSKARVPRDLGAGWDFDDVRDHYLREVFRVDPLELRYSQHDRYLAISRVVSGEVMAATFREWRRGRSSCGGALIWFLRDLWAGSGWGILDSDGAPKAPYFFLKRLLQPRTVFLTDEGGSGVFAHLANEAAEPLPAILEIALYRDGQVCIGTRRREILVPARTTLEIPATSLFEGFIDLTYAYRFGPPPCDVVCATLMDAAGALLARDFHFPLGHSALIESDIGMTAVARMLTDADAEVTLRSMRTARFVSLHVPGFTADDQYFHLAPSIEHRVHLRNTGSSGSLKGEVRALNNAALCRLSGAP